MVCADVFGSAFFFFFFFALSGVHVLKGALKAICVCCHTVCDTDFSRGEVSAYDVHRRVPSSGGDLCRSRVVLFTRGGMTSCVNLHTTVTWECNHPDTSRNCVVSGGAGHAPGEPLVVCLKYPVSFKDTLQSRRTLFSGDETHEMHTCRGSGTCTACTETCSERLITQACCKCAKQVAW